MKPSPLRADAMHASGQDQPVGRKSIGIGLGSLENESHVGNSRLNGFMRTTHAGRLTYAIVRILVTSIALLVLPEVASAAEHTMPVPSPSPSAPAVSDDTNSSKSDANSSKSKSATASLSPMESGDRLRTSVYTRMYDASNLTNSNLPGGRTQTDAVGVNAFVLLHADYELGERGWFVGGTYAYAIPDPLIHESGISTMLETYIGYKWQHLSGELGNMSFTSPWAKSSDLYGSTPLAFQGADLTYTVNAWTFEAADMVRFENKTAPSFTRSTLLTSFPVGAPGMPSNIYVPGGGGIDTSGFSYGSIGYAPKHATYAVNGYFYGVADLLDMFWLSATDTLSAKGWAPSLDAQGGVENNAGASYIGKIRSSVFGLKFGVNPTKRISVSVGVDFIPWQQDTVGGWASPYTDSYASDPLFTTSSIEGMADRHSPGTSGQSSLLAHYGKCAIERHAAISGGWDLSDGPNARSRPNIPGISESRGT